MKSMIAAAFLATALGTSFASAQDAASLATPTRSNQAFDTLAAEKLVASLAHRGITGIASVRQSGDGYLVTPMKDTRPVEVWADPQSGDIQVLNNPR